MTTVPRSMTSIKPASPATGTPGSEEPKIKIERIGRDIDLVPPASYSTSLLLKLVHQVNGRRRYALWAAAGRYDHDAVSVSYKYTGEDTIRVDLPSVAGLSAKSLQQALESFLDEQPEFEGSKPELEDGIAKIEPTDGNA